MEAPSKEESIKLDFIRQIVAEDTKTGKWDGRVVTRFPPEPNGYLHIGHAKSICLNFGIAAENKGGRCHLRFDDTNPVKEEQEYIDSIIEDVRWLGWDWGEHLYYASDYFEQMYEYALELIKKGSAYVCDLTAEQTKIVAQIGVGAPSALCTYLERTPVDLSQGVALIIIEDYHFFPG